MGFLLCCSLHCLRQLCGPHLCIQRDGALESSGVVTRDWSAEQPDMFAGPRPDSARMKGTAGGSPDASADYAAFSPGSKLRRDGLCSSVSSRRTRSLSPHAKGTTPF